MLIVVEAVVLDLVSRPVGKGVDFLARYRDPVLRRVRFAEHATTASWNVANGEHADARHL